MKKKFLKSLLYKEVNFKEKTIQCNLDNYRFNSTIASYLTLPKNAIFLECENDEVLNKSSTKNFEKFSPKRSITTQTFSLEENNNQINLTEKVLINLIENNILVTTNKISQFIHCLEKFSSKSLEFLFNNLNELHARDLIDSLIKLNRTNKLKYLDTEINKHETTSIITNLNNDNNNSCTIVRDLIYQIETSRFGVRFDSNEEKRKQTLNRFKRSVRFVIINKEWFKNLNKEKNSKDEHFKLLTEYNRLNENSAELNKKIQMLFNKDDFKVEKNVNNLITDMQRKILSKDNIKRTNEQLESLQEILSLIPKLNSLPKHLFSHVAQLLTLIVFEKGREIVRGGHKAFGFYFITNGSCDVFSVGNNGLIKIDELSSGDTFGENSFKENDPITPHTIITNRRTELIMVVPSDIESYLSKLHEQEREEKRNFITNWWQTKYWNWSPDNMNTFIKYANFLRFSNDEIILSGSHETQDKIYFIIRGNVNLVRALNKKKLVKLCTLERDNYFGVEENLTLNTWYIAAGYTDLITIDKQKFLSIHKHAYFLLSQLIEDFKLAIPNSDVEIYSYI